MKRFKFNFTFLIELDFFQLNLTFLIKLDFLN